MVLMHLDASGCLEVEYGLVRFFGGWLARHQPGLCDACISQQRMCHEANAIYCIGPLMP